MKEGHLQIFLLSFLFYLCQQVSASTPPIVWTIAGSDSGGGAGIQADLKVFHSLGCHGCTIITAITAQNSHQVSMIEPSSPLMVKATINTLHKDLPPKCVKLGMLTNKEIMEEVSHYLQMISKSNASIFIVCDPVMVSTSGARLMVENSKNTFKNKIIPFINLLTPNRLEAEELVGYPLSTEKDVENAGKDLLRLMKSPINEGLNLKDNNKDKVEDERDSTTYKAVLIKGGHATSNIDYSQDYFTNGRKSFWITSKRYSNPNNHGTGCSLSSAIAGCISHGCSVEDAITLSKAYITLGISHAKVLGKGPGPVSHPTSSFEKFLRFDLQNLDSKWIPKLEETFPWITRTAKDGKSIHRPHFSPLKRNEIGFYPCVPDVEWVKRLVNLHVKDIQLRIKNKSVKERKQMIEEANKYCIENGSRLWVNDYWEDAIAVKAYGLHIGQEDLETIPQNTLKDIAESGIKLGVSTHTYTELGRALAINPSMYSLGPIFPTISKDTPYAPQGLLNLRLWREIFGDKIPLCSIGGIYLENAKSVLDSGADSICVISAITRSGGIESISQWFKLWPTLK